MLAAENKSKRFYFSKRYVLLRSFAVAASVTFFIVSTIISETHRHGFENGATFSLFLGFAPMMFFGAVFAQ